MNQQERKAWVDTLSGDELAHLMEALEDHWPGAWGRRDDVIAYNAFHAGWKAAKEYIDSPTV